MWVFGLDLLWYFILVVIDGFWWLLVVILISWIWWLWLMCWGVFGCSGVIVVGCWYLGCNYLWYGVIIVIFYN